MVYRVPENVCVKGGILGVSDGDGGVGGSGGAAFLPCGVTTALFDEVQSRSLYVVCYVVVP